MPKFALYATAGLLAMTAPAFSQTSQPQQLPSGPANRPAATAPAQPQMVQINGPVRASSLMKATVRNAANEKVADVSDLLVEPDGKVKSVVLGVGGFLGIGERNVAIDLASMKMMQESGGRIVLTSDKLSIEEVKAMPEWKDPAKPATTSAATTPSSTTTPSTAPKQ